MKRSGTTIIELMSVLIILSLVLTGLYRVFSGANRGAREMMVNHQVNDQVQRLLMRISDDIREASYILPDFPKSVPMGQENTLNSFDANTGLCFAKVHYDFTKDPNLLAPDQGNYYQDRIYYYLEPEDPDNATAPWVLMKDIVPFNDRMQEVVAKKSKELIMEGIQDLVFYRLLDPSAPRLGNVYVRAQVTNRDKLRPKGGRYSNGLTTSIKERGSEPVRTVPPPSGS